MCPFTNRINIDPRKSPKLSRATQEISRSPRLPIRKPSIGSPSLTRREFPLDDITQVKAKLFELNSLFSMPLQLTAVTYGLVRLLLCTGVGAVFCLMISLHFLFHAHFTFINVFILYILVFSRNSYDSLFNCNPLLLCHSKITLLRSHPIFGEQSSRLWDWLHSCQRILVQVSNQQHCLHRSALNDFKKNGIYFN